MFFCSLLYPGIKTGSTIRPSPRLRRRQWTEATMIPKASLSLVVPHLTIIQALIFRRIKAMKCRRFHLVLQAQHTQLTLTPDRIRKEPYPFPLPSLRGWIWLISSACLQHRWHLILFPETHQQAARHNLASKDPSLTSQPETQVLTLRMAQDKDALEAILHLLVWVLQRAIF